VENNDLRHVDPLEVDGPGAEYYRELAEVDGRGWPPVHAMTGEQHAALTRRPTFPWYGHGPAWRCPRCHAPAILPDLASTLPYRQCGFLELADGRWIHQ
jgi:hypothetical protein